MRNLADALPTRPTSLRCTSLRAVAALASTLALSGCAQLQSLLGAVGPMIQAPAVSLKEIALAQAPSQKALSAYFCPRVLQTKLNLGVAGELACRGFFGAPPSTDQLKVSFDVRVNVANPNQIPIPLASALTAINVFPGQQQSQLGAVCVSMCGPQDPACAPQDQHACPTSATDITNRAEIAQALGKLVVSEGARLATGEPLGITAPQVSAANNLDVVVRLAFDPQQLLPILEQFAEQAVEQLKQGQMATLAIPYALNGTLFTGNLGTAGVLSAPFGPLSGTWQPQ
jgi:hypothetical protein